MDVLDGTWQPDDEHIHVSRSLRYTCCLMHPQCCTILENQCAQHPENGVALKNLVIKIYAGIRISKHNVDIASQWIRTIIGVMQKWQHKPISPVRMFFIKHIYFTVQKNPTTWFVRTHHRQKMFLQTNCRIPSADYGWDILRVILHLWGTLLKIKVLLGIRARVIPQCAKNIVFISLLWTSVTSPTRLPSKS